MNKPYQLILGDCVEAMNAMEENSVDSVVTDPPYGIRFMGMAWDGKDIEEKTANRALYSQDPDKRAGANGGHKSVAAEAGKYDRRPSANKQFEEWSRVWAEAAFRVLKPGGHLLSFASSRTYHRMTSGIEDAGFEIRDQIMWVFGSGFPKSLDVGKALDSCAGVDREIIGTKMGRPGYRVGPTGDNKVFGKGLANGTAKCLITSPSTDNAKKWSGWGTALKPAHEPIVVARKPLIRTVAATVLQYGTGAINIDGCRVGTDSIPSNQLEEWSGFGQLKRPAYTQTMNVGRWPANLIHDGSEEVLAAFPDSNGQMGLAKSDGSSQNNKIYGALKHGTKHPKPRIETEASAARFYYCAKASRSDRNEGCSEIEPKRLSHDGRETLIDNAYQRNSSSSSNHHPTVKPTSLMRYLVRLVTPPNGLVLDPFMGSGSTGKAALLEGFRFTGIEESADYMKIAERRLAHAFDPDEIESVQKTDSPVGTSHLSLFDQTQE